jgi:hypothetical protein
MSSDFGSSSSGFEFCLHNGGFVKFFLPEFADFPGNSVTPGRNLGDKGHLKGEFQNTLIPYPAYRLLLTPSS